MRTPTLLVPLVVTPALAAAAPPAPPLEVIAQASDFPADAAAAKLLGDVPVTLHIAADGGLECRIDPTNAPKALRRPSCAMVAGRWPYHNGARASDIHLLVRWQASAFASDADALDGATPIDPDNWLVPEEFPTSAIRNHARGQAGLVFDVLPNGTIANCKVEKTSRNRELDRYLCAAVIHHALFLPAADAEGRPRTAMAHYTVKFDLPTG